MSRAARITINSETVSPAKAIATAAHGPSLLILTSRAFTDLCAELGGLDRAMQHLLRISTNVGKPIAVNLPTGEDISSTAFIAPKGWTNERLRGWIGGKREELEALFGEATIREMSA